MHPIHDANLHDRPTAFSAGKGVLVLMAGGLLAAFATMAPPAQVSGTPIWVPGPDGECTLAMEPSSVERGSAPVEVAMTPSSEIPRPDSVGFANGSGLSGELVEERPMHLTLRAAEAYPGEWVVTLYGESQPLCRGTITVEEASGWFE